MGIRTVWTLFNFKSEHFADASKEFSLSQSIISTGIIKLFQTVLYSDTSANGTKKKNWEEDIFYYFTNFLEVLETEGSKVITVFDVDENREIIRKVSLRDVAQFCSDSRHLTGDMKITIQFDHLADESFGKRIQANACSQICFFNNKMILRIRWFIYHKLLWWYMQCTRFLKTFFVKLFL